MIIKNMANENRQIMKPNEGQKYPGNWYPRTWKQWAKKLTAVDLSKSDGSAFFGDWLPMREYLTDVNVGEGDIVLFYGEYGSSKNNIPHACIAKVTAAGEFSKISETIYGRDWAIKIRNIASEAIEKIEPNPYRQLISEIEKSLILMSGEAKEAAIVLLGLLT